MIIKVLLLSAATTLTVAAGLYIAWMGNQQTILRRSGLFFTAVAAAFLAVAGGIDLASYGPSMLPPMSRVLLLVTVGGSVVYLVARIWRDLPIVGPVLTPLGAVTIFAVYWKFIAPAGPTATGHLTAFQVVHIASAILGFLLFVPSYVLSLLFLDQEYRLKTKKPAEMRLPSLMTIERTAWRLLYFGFPLYSMGMILGAVWQEQAGGTVLKPQHVLSVLSWLIYAYAIVRRLRSGWRGRRANLALMAAFVATFGAVLLYVMR